MSTHVGTATASLETATGEEVEVQFKNALYVPKLPKNLISIGQLSNLESASVTMDFNKMILNISDSFSLKMIEKNQLFFLASVNKSYKTCSLSDARAQNNSIQTVHQRSWTPRSWKSLHVQETLWNQDPFEELHLLQGKQEQKNHFPTLPSRASSQGKTGQSISRYCYREDSQRTRVQIRTRFSRPQNQISVHSSDAREI